MSAVDTDWSQDAASGRRGRYYADSQRKLVPYESPLIVRRSDGGHPGDRLRSRSREATRAGAE